MPRNSVGSRAFVLILIVSLGYVLLSSAILFDVGYRAKKAAVDLVVQDLQTAEAESLAKGLWDFDTSLLQALADGIRSNPYVNYVSIDDGRNVLVASGAESPGGLFLNFPISRRQAGGEESRLGALSLQIDSRKELRDLAAQTLPSIALQALFMVFESFMVLFLFSVLATRHLSGIASYIRAYNVRPDAPPLRLEKKDRGDEIDLLVRAYNGMREDVAASREAERRAMESLRLSEERSSVLVEEAPDAIMMFDVDSGVFVECNRRAEELFGRSRKDLVGAELIGFYASETEGEGSLRESVARSLESAVAGKASLVRRRVLRPSGEAIDCEVRLNRIPAAGRKIVRVSYLDVTERVRAEEAMARSLREKEVLLHEVYHRTKNNMQLISSFLSLEADEIGDARLASALNEVNGRIGSMALVHQKLLESRDLSRIDLGDYVQDLVASIKAAYLEGRKGISMSVDVQPGLISLIDVAIPCGLVLNELVVNATKHAFDGRESGLIRVGLRRGEPGRLVLEVSDDGSGLPPGFDFRRDGHVGLQTVLSIVELQLRGSVSFASGAGTSCTAVMRDDLFGARV
jgi:PAS domain S-box-containing protein